MVMVFNMLFVFRVITTHVIWMPPSSVCSALPMFLIIFLNDGSDLETSLSMNKYRRSSGSPSSTLSDSKNKFYNCFSVVVSNFLALTTSHHACTNS